MMGVISEIDILEWEVHLKSRGKIGVRHEVKTVNNILSMINSHLITLNTEISSKTENTTC